MGDLCESISIHRPLRDHAEEREVHSKPTLSDKVVGKTEAAFGHMTHDPELIVEGQATSHGIVRTEKEKADRQAQHRRERRERRRSERDQGVHGNPDPHPHSPDSPSVLKNTLGHIQAGPALPSQPHEPVGQMIDKK